MNFMKVKSEAYNKGWHSFMTRLAQLDPMDRLRYLETVWDEKRRSYIKAESDEVTGVLAAMNLFEKTGFIAYQG